MPLISVNGRRIRVQSIGLRGKEGPPGPGGGDVDSVNGKTGVVELETNDITETTENRFFKPPDQEAVYGTQEILTASGPLRGVVADAGISGQPHIGPNTAVYTDPSGDTWELAVFAVTSSADSWLRIPVIRKRRYPNGTWSDDAAFYQDLSTALGDRLDPVQPLYIKKNGHNNFAVCVTDDGYIHVTGGIQAAEVYDVPPPVPTDNPLLVGTRYARNTEPWNFTFAAQPYFVNAAAEERQSYPKFFKHQGDWYYFARRGYVDSSGNGGVNSAAWLLYKYNDEDSEWENALSQPFVVSGIIDPDNPSVNAGPYSRITSDGERLHICTWWSQSGSFTSDNRLTYARSLPNDVTQWETPAGTPLTLPIGPTDANRGELIENPAGVGNDTEIVVDSSGRPHWMVFVTGGLKHYWRESSGWESRMMTGIVGTNWGTAAIYRPTLIPVRDSVFALVGSRSFDTTSVADVTPESKQYGVAYPVFDVSITGLYIPQKPENGLIQFFTNGEYGVGGNTYEQTAVDSLPQARQQVGFTYELDTNRLPEVVRGEYSYRQFRVLAEFFNDFELEVNATTATSVPGFATIPASIRNLKLTNRGVLWVRFGYGGYVTESGDVMDIGLFEGAEPRLQVKINGTSSAAQITYSPWTPFLTFATGFNQWWILPQAWMSTKQSTGKGIIQPGRLRVQLGEIR